MLVLCACGVTLRVRHAPLQDDPSSDALEVDYYAVLGVPHDASSSEIKIAYRRRARETHPDLGGDPEEFNIVAIAHEVLINPERRRTYDREFGNASTASATRPRFEMPDLIGLSSADAANACAALGLTVRTAIVPVASGHPHRNLVVGQLPFPGAYGRSGDSIGLIVAVSTTAELWRRLREFARDASDGFIAGFVAAATRSSKPPIAALPAPNEVRRVAEITGRATGSAAKGAVQTAGCLARAFGYLLALFVLLIVAALGSPGVAFFFLVVLIVAIIAVERSARERYRQGSWF